MQKDKLYRNVKFDAQTISEADAALGPKNEYKRLVVGFADSEWSFDSFEEFLAAADKGRPTIWVSTSDGKRSLWANTYDRTTRVQVGGRARNEIESIFSIFEKNAERCQLPEEEKTALAAKVFIGHGRNPQWRDLKDHLHEKHGYAVEAYEIGSREGHAVRDILEEMLEESSFALLVMTGETKQKTATFAPVKT